MKKPRGDSKLKTLPGERQAAIAEYAAGHTLGDTVLWLRQDGFVTSATALSEFLSWYGLQGQLRRNESTVATVLEDLRRQDPGMSEEALETAGQMFFSALAIQQQDSLTWKRTQDAKTRLELVRQNSLRLKRETCELFLKWNEDRRAKEVASGSGSHAEKIAQLGKLMFGEDF